MQDLEIRELLPEINPEFAFKVVILGDSGVGKTSLVKYEIQNSFIINNESTIIFEPFFKNFSIREKMYDFKYGIHAGRKCTVYLLKIFTDQPYAYSLYFLWIL